MPDRAHNGPLDVAVSTGLPGLALYLVAGGFLVLRAARAVRSGAPWLIGIGAGVVGYLAQQWFLFPLAEVDPLFWIFAGVLVASTAEGVPVRIQAPRWVSALVMFAAALALVAGLLDVVADHRVRSAFGELAAGNTPAALKIADDATRLRPDSIRYEFLAAVVAAEPGTAIGYAAAVERLDRALELSPGDPILRAEHASFLLRGAQAAQDEALLDLATLEWEALVTVDPVHARYRLELGNAYAIKGRAAAAEEQWLISADLAPLSITPLVNLAGVMIDQGRRVDAVAVLDRARAIDPDSAEIAALQDRLDS